MIPIAKPQMDQEEMKLVKSVMESGMLAQGKRVKELEEKFSELCRTKYAVAVNSGTAALHTSLYAIGIRPGDEVITVPFTFVATANAIVMQGAKPVFVDIEEDTYNINPALIEQKITKKTKAIIPVDLFGQICNHKKIKEIADRHNLKIVEDACQAIGAEEDGVMAGAFGDLGCFSLYATKNIMSGEGGMIVTDNPEYAELARRFRHHGQSEHTKYQYYDLGYNYRLTDLQAAIGIAQLNKLESFTNKRIKNAELLTQGLKGLKGIKVPYVKENTKHVFHQFTIEIDKDFKMRRDEILEYLRDSGIGVGIFYPKPLHLHPFFKDMGYSNGDFPVSEEASERVISLPVHPGVTTKDIQKIIEVFKDA